MPAVSLHSALHICFILPVAQCCAESSSLTQCVTNVTSDSGSHVTSDASSHAQLPTDEPVSMLQLNVKTSQRQLTAMPSSRVNHTGNDARPENPKVESGGDAGGSGTASRDGGRSVRASLADMFAYRNLVVGQSSNFYSMAQTNASARSNDTGFTQSLKDYGHKAIAKAHWVTAMSYKELLLLLPVLIVAGICLITVCFFACCGRSVPPLRFTNQETVKPPRQSEQCTSAFGTRDPGFRIFWPLPPFHGKQHDHHHHSHHHGHHHGHHQQKPLMAGWGQPQTSPALMTPQMQAGMDHGMQGMPPGMVPAMQGMPPLGGPPSMMIDGDSSDSEGVCENEDDRNYQAGLPGFMPPPHAGIPLANGLNRHTDMNMTTRVDDVGYYVDNEDDDGIWGNPWDHGNALGALAEAIDPTPPAWTNPYESQVVDGAHQFSADARSLPPGGSPSVLLPA